MQLSQQAFVISTVLLLGACSGSGAAPGETSQSTASQAMAPTQVSAPQTPAAEMSEEERLLAAGARLFKRCQACHTLDEGGRNRVGPNMWDVFGQKAGHRTDFNYSKAMAASEVIWTEETMAAYIANPRQFMPGNRMAFAGLRKEEDQKAVVAYIKAETTPPETDSPTAE